MGELCFLFGHRSAPHESVTTIRRLAEMLCLQYDVQDFVVGRYGQFDRNAVQAVKMAQMSCPEIRLHLLTVQHPAHQQFKIPPEFIDSIYPEGMERVPKKVALPRANRYMIDRSGYVICYVNGPGNARELLEYARRRQEKSRLQIYNVAEIQTY